MSHPLGAARLAPPTLRDWALHPLPVLVLGGLGALYAAGWTRLRRRGFRRLAHAGRLAAYGGGLAALAVALLSPLDPLADWLFTAHMAQHHLLTMVAAPLLLLGNPLPFALWGAPAELRPLLGRAFTRGAPLRRLLAWATWLPVAAAVYAMALWAWHLPVLYQAALANPWLHDLEHLSLTVAALAFWWPVVEPAPRLPGRRGGLYEGGRVAYLLLAAAQHALLGLVIGLTERPLYPWYLTRAPRLGWTAGEDQAFGGGLMASAGHMFLVPLLVVVHRLVGSEPRRLPTGSGPRPELAPGPRPTDGRGGPAGGPGFLDTLRRGGG